MIRITSSEGKVFCEADLAGRVGVYLDNDSLIDLAKGSSTRRDRFLAAVERGATLLFSGANALELAGPEGSSAAAVDAFVDAVGPQWIPLELNPWKVLRKEQDGAGPQAPVSNEFLTSYFQDRAYELSPEGSRILDLSPANFFRLSSVARWERQQKAERPCGQPTESERLDDALRQRISNQRASFEADPASLDRQLPVIRFSPETPATFAVLGLLRMLVVEAKAYQFKKNDGVDFSHAALASAYGRVITLDKHWKRRVLALPQPNGLAEVYYRAELDWFLERLESLVA